MPNENQKATLRDVLNYEPEKYINEEDMAILKSFTPKHFALIRKIMLPTVSDPDLPVEEFGKDAFLTGVDWTTMSADHVKAIMQGRMEAIKFILGGIIQMRMLANMKEESPYAEALRRKQNSTK